MSTTVADPTSLARHLNCFNTEVWVQSGAGNMTQIERNRALTQATEYLENAPSSQGKLLAMLEALAIDFRNHGNLHETNLKYRLIAYTIIKQFRVTENDNALAAVRAIATNEECPCPEILKLLEGEPIT